MIRSLKEWAWIPEYARLQGRDPHSLSHVGWVSTQLRCRSSASSPLRCVGRRNTMAESRPALHQCYHGALSVGWSAELCGRRLGTEAMPRAYRYVGPKHIAERASASPPGSSSGRPSDILQLDDKSGRAKPIGQHHRNLRRGHSGKLRLADRHSEHVACAGERPGPGRGRDHPAASGRSRHRRGGHEPVHRLLPRAGIMVGSGRRSGRPRCRGTPRATPPNCCFVGAPVVVRSTWSRTRPSVSGLWFGAAIAWNLDAEAEGCSCMVESGRLDHDANLASSRFGSGSLLWEP